MAEKQGKTVKGVGLRLDDEVLNRILDELEEASREYVGSNKRKDPRYPYRHKAIPVEMTLPDGEVLSYRVPSRNLSRSGLAFLHGGYVYAGTRCRIQLTTLHNNWQNVDGVVVWCRYVEGRVHDIGVKFDNPIDVATFASAALPRRILLVDDQESFSRLAEHHLKQMNAEVTLATNGQEAIDKTNSQIFDVILMDIEMPVLDGLSAVKQLRERGYHGSIVAITAHSEPADRERMLAAGFNGYLAKPISKEALGEFISQFDQEPLFSSMANEAGMKIFINQFVTDLATRVKEVEEAAAKRDREGLQRLARELKGEAGSYGFDPVTGAARAVEEAAKGTADKALDDAVGQLVTLCRLVRPTSE